MIFVAQLGEYTFAIACDAWEVEAGVVIAKLAGKIVGSAPAGGSWAVVTEAAYESLRKDINSRRNPESVMDAVFGKMRR